MTVTLDNRGYKPEPKQGGHHASLRQQGGLGSSWPEQNQMVPAQARRRLDPALAARGLALRCGTRGSGVIFYHLLLAVCQLLQSQLCVVCVAATQRVTDALDRRLSSWVGLSVQNFGIANFGSCASLLHIVCLCTLAIQAWRFSTRTNVQF